MSTPPRIQSGDGWLDVATRTQPLKVKLPGGVWRTFGDGTGVPLYEKQADGSWRIIAREGFGADVVVPASSYTFSPRYYSLGGRAPFATANQSGTTLSVTNFLRTGTGTVDYLSKEVGTSNESGHYTATTKKMTHGYFDLRQIFDENHFGQPYPFPVLPPGVEFPYDLWVQADLHVTGSAEHTYQHNRASGFTVYDIRDPGTEAAWAALEHTFARVDPSSIPTETVTGPYTLATPLYHEPGGIPVLSVSSGGGAQSADIAIVRADLDDDVFAFVITADDRPADPTTHPEYSAGWSKWETFTVGGSASFDFTLTLYWPSWSYHT